jgi:hypothetical protein
MNHDDQGMYFVNNTVILNFLYTLFIYTIYGTALVEDSMVYKMLMKEA